MIRIIFALCSCLCLTAASGQDILVLKDNGSAMEGYFQEVTKEYVQVKFGVYTIDLDRKTVDVIIGPPYEELKNEGLLRPLHGLDARDKVIKKAIRKSKKVLKKK